MTEGKSANSDKLFRSVITVTVLSRGNHPPNFGDGAYLVDVAYAITYGGCFGRITEDHEEISVSKMYSLLAEQGSEPAFLLTEEECRQVEQKARREDNTIWCPAGEHWVHADEATHVADHGRCQECHHSWQFAGQGADCGPSQQS